MHDAESVGVEHTKTMAKKGRAPAGPIALRSHPHLLMALQQSAGNRGVARLLQRAPNASMPGPNQTVDPKMSTTPPGATGPPVPAEDMKLIRILDVAKSIQLQKMLEYIPPPKYPPTAPTIVIPGVTPKPASTGPVVTLGNQPAVPPFDPLKSPYSKTVDSDDVKQELAEVDLKSSDDLPFYYDQFRSHFQTRTRTIALFMLATNKDIALKESNRYDNKAEAAGLKKAAGELAKAQAKIFSLQPLFDKDKTKDKPLGKVFIDESLAAVKELNILKAVHGSQFPLLLADGIDFAKVSSADEKALKGIVSATSNPVVENIKTTERNIESGKLDPMNLDPVVEQTKRNFQAGASSEASAEVDRMRTQRAHQASTEALGLGALTIAVGLLAAVPTGGLSLLATLGAVGAAGLSVKQFADSLEQYNIGTAAAGTAINSAAVISSDDPSLLWLAVDLAGAVIDAGAALKAFRSIATAVKTAGTVGEAEKAVHVAIAELETSGKIHPSTTRQKTAATVMEDLRNRRLIGKDTSSKLGLADKDAKATYFVGVKQVMSDAKLATPQAKATEIVNLVNKMLTDRHLPTCHLELVSGMAANGSFNPRDWRIRISIDQLEKMGVERMANTIYHEARHSEQWVMVVRYKHDVLNVPIDQIVKETGMEKSVVESIATAKLGPAGIDYDMGKAMIDSRAMKTQKGLNDATKTFEDARSARLAQQKKLGVPAKADVGKVAEAARSDTALQKLVDDEAVAAALHDKAYKEYLDAQHEVDARMLGDTVGAALALSPK